MDSAVMGMEDRDWYREKRIDWNKGGLTEKHSKNRRFPGWIWWIIAVVLVFFVFFLFRQY